MSEPGAQPNGWFASLRRLGDSLLALAESRLQLFALELQAERLLLVEVVLRLGLALALGAAGLAVGVTALALLAWQGAGLAGLLVLAGVLLGGAALILGRLRGQLRNAPTPFADTLAEFRKDRACLQEPD